MEELNEKRLPGARMMLTRRGFFSPVNIYYKTRYHKNIFTFNEWVYSSVAEMGNDSILCRIWDRNKAKHFLKDRKSIFDSLNVFMCEIADANSFVANEVSFILTPRRFYVTMPNREFLELSELDWIIDNAKDLLRDAKEYSLEESSEGVKRRI